MFDSSMVNEPSGFEPLKFYCIYNIQQMDYVVQKISFQDICPKHTVKAKISLHVYWVRSLLGFCQVYMLQYSEAFMRP